VGCEAAGESRTAPRSLVRFAALSPTCLDRFQSARRSCDAASERTIGERDPTQVIYTSISAIRIPGAGLVEGFLGNPKYILTMELKELLRRYEATGDEATYVEANAGYEVAIDAAPHNAELHHEYGYLRECHARNELRLAAARYERAIELEPEWAKPRYQLLAVRAALLEIEDAIRVQRERLAARPDDIQEHRLLAAAYLLSHRPEQAEQIAASGLRLAPDDAALTRALGEAAAARGRTDQALVHWRRARELDPEDISTLYSAAFALERDGRVPEAADEWRAIIDWCAARGLDLEIHWPQRELARLEAQLHTR
jgi:tetratricopeptide (TPR) repeat protein